MADNNFYSNFTERQRIKVSDAMFKVSTSEGVPRSFSTSLSLDSYAFDPRSKVIVDAYTTSTNSRLSFDGCGTIGSMNQMENVFLDRMEASSLMKFTVKVVRPGDFTIQGLIEGISTYQTEETGDGTGRTGSVRNSLLPVNYGAGDLGQIPCRLRFEDDSPYLDINKSIKDARNRLVDSPHFRGVLFPVFVEEILKKAIYDIGPGEIGDGDGWPEKWARFAIGLTGGNYPGEQSSEIDEWLDDWALDAAKEFAQKWSLKDSLDEYLNGGISV